MSFNLNKFDRNTNQEHIIAVTQGCVEKYGVTQLKTFPRKSGYFHAHFPIPD